MSNLLPSSATLLLLLAIVTVGTIHEVNGVNPNRQPQYSKGPIQEPAELDKAAIKEIIETGLERGKVYTVWKDPKNGKMMTVHSDNAEFTKPRKTYEESHARDSEQHFVAHLKRTNHHNDHCKSPINDIWVTYTPCPVCSRTLINYYRTYDTKYTGQRPTIHVMNVYKESGNDRDLQEDNRAGLQALRANGFKIVQWDFDKLVGESKEMDGKVKTAIEEYNKIIKSPPTRKQKKNGNEESKYEKYKERNDKTRHCLKAFFNKCDSQKCGNYGTPRNKPC